MVAQWVWSSQTNGPTSWLAQVGVGFGPASQMARPAGWPWLVQKVRPAISNEITEGGQFPKRWAEGELGEIGIQQALGKLWISLGDLKTTEELVQSLAIPLDLMQQEFGILRRPTDLLLNKSTPHKKNTNFHVLRSQLAKNREYQSTRSQERQTRRGMWFAIKDSVDHMKSCLEEKSAPSELFQAVAEFPWAVGFAFEVSCLQIPTVCFHPPRPQHCL